MTRAPLLALLLAACGGTRDGDWAVPLAGSDAWLAVNAAGGNVVAYVCGGPITLTTSTRWFAGAFDGDRFALAADGWQLSGALSGSRLSGELIEPHGVATAWTADAMPPEGAGGIYFAIDSRCRAGVIVLQQGGTTALQGAACDDAGNMLQVTPVAPVAALEERAPIEVEVALPQPRQFVAQPLVDGVL